MPYNVGYNYSKSDRFLDSIRINQRANLSDHRSFWWIFLITFRITSITLSKFTLWCLPKTTVKSTATNWFLLDHPLLLAIGYPDHQPVPEEHEWRQKAGEHWSADLGWSWPWRLCKRDEHQEAAVAAEKHRTTRRRRRGPKADNIDPSSPITKHHRSVLIRAKDKVKAGSRQAQSALRSEKHWSVSQLIWLESWVLSC